MCVCVCAAYLFTHSHHITQTTTHTHTPTHMHILNWCQSIGLRAENRNRSKRCSHKSSIFPTNTFRSGESLDSLFSLAVSLGFSRKDSDELSLICWNFPSYDFAFGFHFRLYTASHTHFHFICHSIYIYVLHINIIHKRGIFYTKCINFYVGVYVLIFKASFPFMVT